jgi:hypothetical protein
MNTLRTHNLLASIVTAAVALAPASCERSLAGARCPCVSGYTCCANDDTCHPAGTACTAPGDADGGGPGPGSDGGGARAGSDGGGGPGPDGGPRAPTVFPHLCTSDGWCGATPGFSAVWGSAPDDLWVLVSSVGDYPTISAPLHFDGKDWTAVSIQPRDGSIYGPPQLVTLWGSGPSDVFAVGYSGGIMHFDGVRWSDQSIGDQNDESTQVYFRGVAGSGPDDVWAVGLLGGMAHFDGSAWSLHSRAVDGPDLTAVWVHDRSTAWAVGPAGLIERWDGTRWSPVQDGFGGTPTTEDLTAIWGSGADDVWAVGKNGTALHFDGANWQSHSYDVPTHADLLAVWGRGRDDVWATGAGGVLLHWTGAAWYTATSGTKEDLHGIWASAGGDVWAVGDTSASVHWDGAAWVASPPPPPTWGSDVSYPPPPDMLPKNLYAVWGEGPDNVWVAGDAGVMLHFDGQQWRPASILGLGQNYRAIWGDGNGAFWFVGTGGTIVATYDPSRDPSRVYPNGGYGLPDLAAIWGTSADNVWAVGAGGAIVHLDGQTWSAVPSPTTADINSLWGFAADDIWASTRSEEVLHFDGAAWSAIPVAQKMGDMTFDWLAVFGIAHDDLWLTGSYTISGYMSGSGGPLYRHWDGSAWSMPDFTVDTVPLGSPGGGEWRSGPSSLWVVNWNTARRLDGATLVQTHTGASGALRAIWGSSPDDIWAVGDKGTILHRKLSP